MGIQPDILYQGTTSVVPKAAYEQNGFSRCKQVQGLKPEFNCAFLRHD
jgi:hypothetical protein